MSGIPSTISLSKKGTGGRDIIVTGDFYISLEFGPESIEIAEDSGPTQGRSYDSLTTPPTFVPISANYMIRAEVAQSAVGGYVVPTSALGVLAPYLATITLVAVAVVTIEAPQLAPEQRVSAA
jgi:hypothetical protein